MALCHSCQPETQHKHIWQEFNETEHIVKWFNNTSCQSSRGKREAPQSPHCHKCWVCCLTSSQEAGGGVYTVCSSRLLRFSNFQASIRVTFLFTMDNWTNQERLVCCLTSSQEARGAVYTVFSSRLLRFSHFQVSSKFSVWTMDVACLPQRLRYLMVTLKGGGRPGIY